MSAVFDSSRSGFCIEAKLRIRGKPRAKVTQLAQYARGPGMWSSRAGQDVESAPLPG